MQPDQAREHLSAERTRLLEVRQTMEDIDKETEREGLSELSGVDQHQADLGTETFNRERDLSILESVEAELSDIERALQRLDEGTYGKCEACGKPIGEERLAAMPATRFCLEDREIAEREARMPRPGE